MFNLLHFIQTFDGNNARFLIDAYPDYPVYATVAYLLCVFYLPGFLRRHHKTFKLKGVSAAWNLFLSVFSTFGAYYTVSLIYEFVFVSRDFYTTACEMIQTPEGDRLTSYTRRLHDRQWRVEKPVHQNYGKFSTESALVDTLRKQYYVGPTAFFVAFFIYLKTPELLDTILLILQGKPVSFLHWFHHIVTAIYCWHGGYVLTPSGLFFIGMNYTVHSVMYFYYFLVVLGFRDKIRWFAPCITLMQCSQMFFGMYITCYTYFHYWLGPAHQGELFYAFFHCVFRTAHAAVFQLKHLWSQGGFANASQVPEYKMNDHFFGCDVDTTNLRMSVMMFTAYCVLFVTLFYELFIAKSQNKHSLVVARRESRQQQQQQQPGEDKDMEKKASSSASAGKQKKKG